MQAKTKKRLILAGKITLSIALLVIAFFMIDTDKLKTALEELKAIDAVILVALFWGTIFIGAIRSKIFFRGMGINLSYFLYAKLYYIGYFFNFFIPSGVGGDVMRGWIAGKRVDKIKESYSAILGERLSGLIATGFIALIFMLFVDTPKPLILILILANIGLWLIAAILLTPHLAKITRRILKPLPFGISDKISDFSEKVSTFRSMPGILLGGFAMSVLYQLSIIFVVYMASHFLKSGITFAEMCVIAPIVWTVAMIPATPNALGIRELTFAYLFPVFGSQEAKGLVVSGMFLFVSVASGIAGGIVFGIENMLGKRRGTGGILAPEEPDINPPELID